MNDATRRPVKSRGVILFQKFAAWLARTGVTPNHISLASIFFAAIAAWFFTCSHYWILLAAAGIQLRLFCNLMDGMVAIEHQKETPTGELYNEIPDRFSDSLILVGIGLCPGVSMSLALAAALAAMFTAYIRVLGASVGARAHFAGPMAKQQRMALLTLLAVAAPFLPTNSSFSYSHVCEITLWIIAIGSVVTAFRRLHKISVDLNSKA